MDLARWRAVYLGTAAVSVVLAVLATGLLAADEHTVTRRGATYLTALASVATPTVTNRASGSGRRWRCSCSRRSGCCGAVVLPLSAEPWHLSTTTIGLFGVAGLAGALGAGRSGRWSDRGRGGTVTVLALILLISYWGATGQAPRSLQLLALGVILLDFAVQAVQVTSQNQIIATGPAASSGLVGSYMVFYSRGSALGAVSASSLYAVGGWAATSVGGAIYATVALAVWGIDRAWP